MNDRHQSIAAKKIILKYKKYKKYNKHDRHNAFYTQQETEILIRHYRQKQPVRVKTVDAKYHLIENSRQLKELLDPLVDTVERIGIDTETTDLDPYLNQVRLIQIAIAKHPVFIIDLAAIKKSQLTPLKHLLVSNCLKSGSYF